MKENMMHKMAGILMTLVLVITMSLGSASVVLAEDEQPADIQDTYTIGGITYYNTGSDSFSSEQEQYIKDVLLGQSSELAWQLSDTYTYNRSMADLWLEAAAGLIHGRDYLGDGRYTAAIDKAACSGSQYNSYRIGDNTYQTYRYPNPLSSNYDMKSSDMASPKAAEQYLYRTAQLSGNQSSTGYFKNSSDGNPKMTFVAAIKATNSPTTRMAAVYFNNFKIVALFPEDEGKNFVTSTSDSEHYSKISASTVKNNTGGTVDSSQTVSRNYSWSVTSSVSGSESYSYEESIKVSSEFKFGIFEKLGVEAGFTATQAFEKGWSKEDGYEDSDGTEQQISVELPPYTNVMMTQKTTTADYTTRYNCPVGITFDATIVIYDNNGVVSAGGSPMVFVYQNNAGKNLAKRYKEWKGESENADPDGVRWYYATIGDSSGDTHIAEAIGKTATFVPMSPTGAQFRQKMNVVAGEVAGLMPIYPLKTVRANDISMDMEIGDSVYTRNLDISGYNEKNAPYYGFDKENGCWKVVDEDGNELTGADSPLKLVKVSVSGNMKVQAVNPGTCYLKYFIDEDVYSTADNPEQFTTNSELANTAVIEINVKDNRSIAVRGSFEGYVDEAPEALDADGKLYASVYDGSGVEIDADITWEKRERKGIEITDNMVSFTKPGTYGVRACCGELKSDWIEITAIKRPSDESDKEEVKPTPAPTPTPTPGSGSNSDQKGADGTPVGPGASAAAAEKAITNMVSDADPQGTVFGKLALKSTKQGKTSVSLAWNPVPNAASYVIYGNKCGKGIKPVKIGTTSGNKHTVGMVGSHELEKGTYYKFIMVALDKNNKVVSTSKVIHVATKGGKVGNHKNVTVKKSVINKAKKLKKGKTLKLKAKAVPQSKKLKVKKHRAVSYESTNANIATVSKNGVVKAKNKGTCYIYAYAQNGVFKKVKIAVK